MYDVIIIGAGPAGLSAALVLGRCRRKVLVVDSDRPRNGVSQGLHGYLTRDGVHPRELRRLGRADVAAYSTVECVNDTVIDARCQPGGFEIVTENGGSRHARLLLLATGRMDPLPPKPGFKEFYGRGVYHCPYCDGWEHRDQPMAVYGNGERAMAIASELLTWTTDVTICTDGAPSWNARDEAPLRNRRIKVIDAAVVSLEGNGRLQRIRFEGGEGVACDAIFFLSTYPQRSSLPAQLGCSLDDESSVVCEGNAATNVSGLFVAGNVRGGLHFAITAAAEGVEAAVAMNDALLDTALAPR